MIRSDAARLEALLRDQAVRAARSGRTVTGRFLPETDCGMAVHLAREAGFCASFDGGHEGAERVQVCFHPREDAPVFDAVWMEIRWDPRAQTPDHRALLGSLMALGVDRSFAGDLIAGEDRAWLRCLPTLAAMLPDQWHEAGRTAISVRLPEDVPELPTPVGKKLRDTVASPRLDAVLAAALGKSRESAAERVRRGDVAVNHHTEVRVDRQLAPGDLLSVRGFGRIRVTALSEPNRKGRLPIQLEVFSRDP